jgi:hypothetical protein
MTRRRSLRHLAYVAAASGLVTLAVAVTGISPVWLAVGPLLLVLVDTLAFSPTVRRRLRAVAPAPRRRLLSLAHTSYIDLHMWKSLPPIVLWVLGLLALVTGVTTSVVYLPPFVWASVLAVAVAVLVVFFGLRPRLEGRFEVRVPSFRVTHIGQEISPTRWLQSQLDAAGEGPLTVVVVAFDGPVPAGLLADALAEVARHGARFHHLSANEFLLVGSSASIHSALSLLGLGRFRLKLAGEPLGSVAFDVGEALYPHDGSTAEQLIAKARQARRSPRD